MGRYDHADERDIWRALVVQKYGPDEVDALDYLAAQSRADDGRDPVGRSA